MMDLLKQLNDEEESTASEALNIIISKYYETLLKAINVIPRVMFTVFEEGLFQSSPIHFRLVKNKGYWQYTHDKTQSYREHYYRMKKATFNSLVEILGRHPAFQLRERNSTPTYMQVAAVIWRHANCHFGYRMVEAMLYDDNYHTIVRLFAVPYQHIAVP